VCPIGSVRVHVTSRAWVRSHIHRKIILHNAKEVEIQQSGYMEVEVEDEGAGLAPDQIQRLFQQGVQFDANRLQGGEGSGLGLFIAKGIAEQHKGSLKVRSPGLGMGTTFTLSHFQFLFTVFSKIAMWTILSAVMA